MYYHSESNENMSSPNEISGGAAMYGIMLLLGANLACQDRREDDLIN